MLCYQLAPRDVVTYLVGTVSAHVSEDRITREMACRYAEIHSEELSSKLIAECNPKDDDIVERVFRSLVSAIIHTSERDTLPQGILELRCKNITSLHFQFACCICMYCIYIVYYICNYMYFHVLHTLRCQIFKK